MLLLFLFFIAFGVFSLIFYRFLFSSDFKKREKVKTDSTFEKKRAMDYPPAFPNGWFSICASSEVKEEGILEIDAFGEKLVVFRTKTGEISVIDAFCPHLGANLAHGHVDGEKIVCPFHGWNFNAQGVCTKIPYAEDNNRVGGIKIPKWEVQENWGLVMVWHHSEGLPPSWDTSGYLPQLKEYKYLGRKEEVLKIHLQEFFENGADFAHFSVVHKLLTIPFVNKLVHIKHIVDIKFGTGKESHMAFFYDIAQVIKNKDNTLVKGSEGRGDVTFFGPGILAFVFDTKLANPIILKTFTPMGELKVKMVDYIFYPKGTLRLASKIVVQEATAQFNDDIKIWETKKFLKNPMLVKGDGPIMKVRKWYSQFYS